MFIKVEQKNTKYLLKTPLVQQTSFWSEVKKEQGIIPRAFDIRTDTPLENDPSPKGSIHDDILVLIRRLDRHHSIAYVPYGPLIEPREDEQGAFLEELSENLRPFLPDDCITLRYDLHWQSHWAKDESHFDENGIWKGRPDKNNQEFRFNFNTKEWNLKKANTDILPSNTIFLDLNRPESEIIEKMKPKTRYNIKLAGKKGVSVRNAGPEELDLWYDLYRQTCRRNGIYLHDLSYFTSVLKAVKPETDPLANAELLIAEHNGIPLAAIFFAVSDKRATYLYGASSSLNRNLMGTYAVQWEAITRAKKKGCTKYDMFGVSPKPDPAHPMYGLYKFKKGFGGRMFHRMGCWDYPLLKDKYKVYSAGEMTAQGYHLG
ncbi:MAG: peptidoglycan bridge formation glycyltransferase FemA/FemB family protein [Candidatus Delongbacteria bacterium]